MQKLQPIGQPTDGIMVADGSPPPCGIFMPSMREPNEDPDGRMLDRRVNRFAQKLAEPPDPFALDDVVCIQHLLDAGDRGHMAADHNGRFRGVLPDQPAHLAHFAHVADDARDSDHLVLRGT